MKKFMFIIMLSSACFAKWVMIEGKHHTNDAQAMYMYNDETGTIYIGEPIYKEGKDGRVYPSWSGFQRVPFIYQKKIKVKL